MKLLSLLAMFLLAPSMVSAKGWQARDVVWELSGPDGTGFGLNIFSQDGDLVAVARMQPFSETADRTSLLVVSASVYVADQDEVKVTFDARGEATLDHEEIRLSGVDRERFDSVMELLGDINGGMERFSAQDKVEAWRLVLRDEAGKFLAWKDLTADLVSGWNLRDDEWVYEVRYRAGLGKLSGQIVNAAYLNFQIRTLGKKLYVWRKNGDCPYLMLRDTRDSGNNGKYLVSVKGLIENDGSGEVCVYRPAPSAFLSDEENSRILTTYPL